MELEDGAGKETRTPNNFLGREAFYQLNYTCETWYPICESNTVPTDYESVALTIVS